MVRQAWNLARGNAARKLDQYAARKVIHRKDVYSTPILCGDSKTDPLLPFFEGQREPAWAGERPQKPVRLHLSTGTEVTTAHLGNSWPRRFRIR